MIRRLALTTLSLLALSGCDLLGGGDAAAGDADSALDAIHAVEAAQFEAVQADDLAGVIAPYAADAVLVAPGTGPVSGPAISQTFEALLADEAFALEMVEGSESARVSADGNLAVTGFTAMLTHDNNKGGTVTERMINQTVWQRSDAGTWQIASDMNYLVPETPEATPTAAATPAAEPVGKPTEGGK